MSSEERVWGSINESSEFKNVADFLFSIFVIQQIISLSWWFILQSVFYVEISSTKSAEPLCSIIQEIGC